MIVPGNKELFYQASQALRDRLPRGWNVEIINKSQPDAPRIRLSSPDRIRKLLTFRARQGLAPRDVEALLRREDDVVVAPYLSGTTRSRLRLAEINYLDLTGNVRIELRKPALFIDTGGADVAPDSIPRGSRTLRGERAGQVIRFLIDRRVPGGVRQIAKETGGDPGYVSRVLALLDREVLIEREGRGKITYVNWQALLRRWAEEAPLKSRGGQVACLDPRGPAALLARLPAAGEYYVTGSFAAARLAPISAPRVLTIYAPRGPLAFAELGLRPATGGANVLVIQPTDAGPVRDFRVDDGIKYVAVSQVAADLLGGTGREPAEGEALLEWMTEHEEKWRG